jgi:multidrug efflux pump subunit AcrA (membrane-fusion protein)
MIPGMSAEAIFQLHGAGPALQVPRDALVRGTDGGHRVWVIERESGEPRAYPRDVGVGRALGETVEIVSGLDTAQPVVVRGNESLREGQAVRIVGED